MCVCVVVVIIIGIHFVVVLVGGVENLFMRMGSPWDTGEKRNSRYSKRSPVALKASKYGSPVPPDTSATATSTRNEKLQKDISEMDPGEKEGPAAEKDAPKKPAPETPV